MGKGWDRYRAWRRANRVIGWAIEVGVEAAATITAIQQTLARQDNLDPSVVFVQGVLVVCGVGLLTLGSIALVVHLGRDGRKPDGDAATPKGSAITAQYR